MSDLKKRIDTLLYKLEKYMDDFGFRNYIEPLINDPDNLTEIELENLKKVLEYYQNYGIYLPLPNDPL